MVSHEMSVKINLHGTSVIIPMSTYSWRSEFCDPTNL